MSAGRLAEALAGNLLCYDPTCDWEDPCTWCRERGDHLADVVLDLLDSPALHAAVESALLGRTAINGTPAVLAAIRTHLTTPTKEENNG